MPAEEQLEPIADANCCGITPNSRAFHGATLAVLASMKHRRPTREEPDANPIVNPSQNAHRPSPMARAFEHSSSLVEPHICMVIWQ